MKDETSADPLIVTHEAPIGWLVLNRPQVRNALNLRTWQRMAEGVAELASDDAIRVIVMRGSTPQAFIAGADISEFPAMRADAAQARAYRDAPNARNLGAGRMPQAGHRDDLRRMHRRRRAGRALLRHPYRGARHPLRRSCRAARTRVSARRRQHARGYCRPRQRARHPAVGAVVRRRRSPADGAHQSRSSMPKSSRTTCATMCSRCRATRR